MPPRARVQIRPADLQQCTQDGTHRLRDLKRAWVLSQRQLLEGGAARLIDVFERRGGGSLYRTGQDGGDGKVCGALAMLGSTLKILRRLNG